MTKHLIVLCLILTGTSLVRAQQKLTARQEDSLNVQFARQTGTTVAKAGKIRTVYNYKNEEIRHLMMDTSMKLALRQQLIKQLLAERRQQIDAVLTPALKDTLKRKQDIERKKSGDRIQEFSQQHLAQLNKVPHKRRIGISKTDSIKARTNFKPRTKI